MIRNMKKWDCWEERPQFIKKSEWILLADLYYKRPVITVLVVASVYITDFIKIAIYYATLPFAFVNEFIRSIR